MKPPIIFLITLIAVVGAGCVFAGEWSTNAEGVVVFNQRPRLNETFTWSGGVTNGFADGSGTLIWKIKGVENARFVGSMSNGLESGWGVYITADGAKGEGEWLNGLREGKWTLKWKNGGSYIGDYKNNQRTGKGTELMVGGHSYTGDFLNAKFHGHGVQVLADGTRYDGEFRNSKMNGLGNLKYANGGRYQGHFIDNVYNGLGKLTYPDGRTIEGLWENNELVKRMTLDESDYVYKTPTQPEPTTILAPSSLATNIIKSLNLNMSLAKVVNMDFGQSGQEKDEKDCIETVIVSPPAGMMDGFTHTITINHTEGTYSVYKTGGIAGVNEKYGPIKIEAPEINRQLSTNNLNAWVNSPVPTPKTDAWRLANSLAQRWSVQVQDGNVVAIPCDHTVVWNLPFLRPTLSTREDGISTSIKVSDGWLVGFNGGEFGGSVWWYSLDGEKHNKLSDDRLVSFIRIGEQVYGLEGLAHRHINRGSVVRFEKTKKTGEWASSKFAILPEEPCAVVQYKSKSMLVVTYSSLVVVEEDGSVKQLIKDSFYGGLYPQSAALDSNGALYIGMNQGIANVIAVLKLP